MERRLHFLCPTDHLETIVNRQTSVRNYYWTSLGNAISFTPDVLDRLIRLVEAETITRITFIIAADNTVVADAMGKQHYRATRGMAAYYREIAKQQALLRAVWPAKLQLSVTATLLDAQVKALSSKLPEGILNRLAINALIYHRSSGEFTEVHVVPWLAEDLCAN